ncbi:ribonuclease HII, partial [Gordonia sp. i37]
RDRIMVAMDGEVPGYSFAVHKGYSTALHMSCLDRLGPSAQHRMSYRNVASRRLLATAEPGVGAAAPDAGDHGSRDRLTG